MSVQQLLDEAKKYRAWMSASKGGVTLSGGEPLSQAEFVAAFFDAAHNEGMHCALDTSGSAPLSKAKPALDASDLVILDIKGSDPQKFYEVCQVDIQPTLNVLEYLISIEKPLWIRHVVVPGLTDDKHNLSGMLELVKRIPNLQRFEFLPFHKLGESKWVGKSTPYRLKETPPPSQEFMDKLNSRFRNEGIPIP